jgi:hypothetical protein
MERDNTTILNGEFYLHLIMHHTMRRYIEMMVEIHVFLILGRDGDDYLLSLLLRNNSLVNCQKTKCHIYIF